MSSQMQVVKQNHASSNLKLGTNVDKFDQSIQKQYQQIGNKNLTFYRNVFKVSNKSNFDYNKNNNFSSSFKTDCLSLKQMPEDYYVTGANRIKYFHNPISVCGNYADSYHFKEVNEKKKFQILSSPEPDCKKILTIGDEEMGEKERTFGTQTDYREGETQTDPYNPDFIVKPGSKPELLSIAKLTYGKGLPAGLAEVELIEKLREKRAWQAKLPSLDDPTQLEKRKRLMEEQERKEWMYREQEIQKLHDIRLEVIKKMLREKEKYNEKNSNERFESLRLAKEEDADKRNRRIKLDHLRAIRKLIKKRYNVEGKLKKVDIANEYSEYGSHAFAPLTRLGVFVDRPTDKYNVESRYLNTYKGLIELDEYITENEPDLNLLIPKRNLKTKDGFFKKSYKEEQKLEEIYELIRNQKNTGLNAPKPLKFLRKIERAAPRLSTPTKHLTNDKDDNRKLAVITLQLILRGRLIQLKMLREKEDRIELIKESRSTYALRDAEKILVDERKNDALRLIEIEKLNQTKELIADQLISDLEGDTLGTTLDYLNKQLIRLEEERRIHAFSLLAERSRRIREAEEAGHRQKEEKKMKEADDIFKQMAKVHQETVDIYLEDIILQSVDKLADEEARVEIQEMAKIINETAYSTQLDTELEVKEVVANLVHGFLLPEVYKRTMQEKINLQQRKYLEAAHESLLDEFPKLFFSREDSLH